MSTAFFNKGREDLLSGTNPTTADLRLLLVTTGYTFNSAHHFVSDVSANEVAGTGYARKTLGSLTRTTDDTNNIVYVDCADFTYTAPNAWTAKAGILYRNTGSDASSPLWVYFDSTDFPKTATGVDLTWTVNVGGLFKAQ